MQKNLPKDFQISPNRQVRIEVARIRQGANFGLDFVMCVFRRRVSLF